jgi:hypothetical protein
MVLSEGDKAIIEACVREKIGEPSEYLLEISPKAISPNYHFA